MMLRREVASEEWIGERKVMSNEQRAMRGKDSNEQRVMSNEIKAGKERGKFKEESGKKKILGFKLLLVAFYSLLIASSTSFSQTLPSFFSDADLQTLERLVVIAEANDLQILEYQAELGVNEASFGFTGRLGEALSVNAGTSVSGSYYGQAELSYNLSISLNVMELLSVDDTSGVINQRIQSAKLATRVRVVEAFVSYKIALVNAETKARSVEASQARYEVAVTRVQAGESILSSQINAQSDLASAGLSLYSANGEVIVSLERLAAVVGITPQAVVGVLNER